MREGGPVAGEQDKAAQAEEAAQTASLCDEAIRLVKAAMPVLLARLIAAGCRLLKAWNTAADAVDDAALGEPPAPIGQGQGKPAVH